MIERLLTAGGGVCGVSGLSRICRLYNAQWAFGAKGPLEFELLRLLLPILRTYSGCKSLLVNCRVEQKTPLVARAFFGLFFFVEGNYLVRVRYVIRSLVIWVSNCVY